MDVDGAAQDEMVTDGPGYVANCPVGSIGQNNVGSSHYQRSMSPLIGLGMAAGSSTTSINALDMGGVLPIAENWCNTQVKVVKFNYMWTVSWISQRA